RRPAGMLGEAASYADSAPTMHKDRARVSLGGHADLHRRRLPPGAAMTHRHGRSAAPDAGNHARGGWGTPGPVGARAGAIGTLAGARLRIPLTEPGRGGVDRLLLATSRGLIRGSLLRRVDRLR